MTRHGYDLPLRWIQSSIMLRKLNQNTVTPRFVKSRTFSLRDRWNLPKHGNRSYWKSFWQGGLSDLEAKIILTGWAVGQVTGISLLWYIVSTDKAFRSNDGPQYSLETRDVPFQQWDETALAPTGASKSTNSHYQKLLDRNDIRVLVLHPGQWDDDIHVHMEQISLHAQHPAYEALSYTWGNEDTTKFVRIAEKEIPVTPNVHAALRRLRHAYQNRRLWVDAMCIDQSDINERNQQIPLFGDVYSEAIRVVVWLGEESHDSARAFESLQSLHSSYTIEHRPDVGMLGSPQWSRKGLGSVLERSIAVSGFGNIIHSNIHKIDWGSVRNLLERDWFHRLWVIQEVTHAKTAIVVCGSTSVDWTVLSNAISQIWEHNLTGRYLNRLCTHACESIIKIEKMRHQKVRDPLFKVVLTNSYGGCTDPRDKIFAMMSISAGRDKFDWTISFDYTLSTAELYKRFAIWDIMKNGTLRSLACATTGPNDSAVPPPFPSWVPDWTHQRSPNLLVCCEETSQFSAALDTESDVWFTQDKERMHVRGIIVDTIHTIGRVPYLINTTSALEIDDAIVSHLHLMNEWFRECWDIARNGTPMTKDKYEALWRTLICGLNSNGHPAPKAYSRYFRTYLAYIRQAPKILGDHLNDMTDSRAFNKWFNSHCGTGNLIEDSLQTWSAQKRFCRTEDGRLARVPINAAVGDSICILYGSKIPYIIRLQEDGDFTVIGECYVHGIMHGEALKSGLYSPVIIRLV